MNVVQAPTQSLSVQPLAQQPSLNVAQAPQQQITSVGQLGQQQAIKPDINYAKIAQDIPTARQIAPNSDMSILEAIVKKNPSLSTDTTEAFKRATNSGVDVGQTATQILDHIQQKYTLQAQQESQDAPGTAALKGVYTDLIKPLGGIIKPAAQGLVSGYRALQSTPQILKGDYQGAAETQAKPANLPFFGETTPLAGLKNGQALGLAAQVGSNLIGLGESGTLPSIASGSTKQAIVQGLKQGGLAGAGSALENNPNPQFNTETSLNTAGAAITGGLTGGLTAGLAAKIQPLFTRDITPGQALQATKEGVLSPVKTLKNSVSPDVESSLTRAIKPGKNNINFVSDLKTSIPLIQETSQITGKPINDLESLDHGITATKQRVWTDYQNILGPNAKATIDGNQIADSMVSALDKRFIAQNPEKAAAIQATADTYRRQIPLGEAEEFLQSANNDLHAYYAKNKVNQSVAARDPEKGYVVKEADGLREALYSKLNDLTGKNAAQIKKAYGSLTNLQNEVIGRKNVNARQSPVSLGQQVSRISAAGDLLKGIDLSKPGQTVANVGSGLAKIALGNHMRNLNDSDYLVNNAFAKLNKQPLVKNIKPKAIK